jgi:hypothetical protein
LYQQQKNEKKIRETIPFTIASNNKVSWNKFDKGNQRPVL